MRRVIILSAVLIVVVAWLSSEILARGGRGGGRGGARVGGGAVVAGGGRMVNHDLPHFADLSSVGNTKFDFGAPSTGRGDSLDRFAGGALAGGAAAAFLHDNPDLLLPGVAQAIGGPRANMFPDRPSGGTKPSTEKKPATGDRPGAGRPDIGRPGQPDKQPLNAGQREVGRSGPNRIRDRVHPHQ